MTPPQPLQWVEFVLLNYFSRQRYCNCFHLFCKATKYLNWMYTDMHISEVSYASGPVANKLTRPRNTWADNWCARKSSPSTFHTPSFPKDVNVKAGVYPTSMEKVSMDMSRYIRQEKKKRNTNKLKKYTLWCSTNLKSRGSPPFLASWIRCLQIK